MRGDYGKVTSLLLLAAVVCLAGCGFGHHHSLSNDETAKIERRAGFQYFAANLRPYLETNCNRCHGVTQEPKFSAGAPTQQYTAVRTLVGFPAYDTGKVMVRATNNHCGDGCRDGNRTVIEPMLAAWWQAEQASENLELTGNEVTSVVPGTVSTAPQDISGNATQTLTWTLPRIAGGSITVTVEPFAGTNVRIRNPRLRAPTSSAVHAKRIILVVNGTYSSEYSPFEAIDRVIVAGSEPTLVTNSTTVPIGSGLKLAIAFGTLETTAAAQTLCKADSLFTIVASMMRSKCFGCHQGGNTSYGARAVGRFRMPDGNAPLCAESKSRIDESYVQRSPLPLVPANQMNNHPSVSITAGELNNIYDWETAELN